MKVGIVVPHIFMHQDILPQVIFSPGTLALDLAEGLAADGVEVTLFTPGPVQTTVRNITADLGSFEVELELRGDTYIDLLKKHPLTFISLARQVQSELLAKAFEMANQGRLDVLHIYTNEEDTALPFSRFCTKPVVFTHHDPFNFYAKYRSVFPSYKGLNWVSISYAQRKAMPADTNWVANIYHGIPKDTFKPFYDTKQDYVAYMGRVIEAKGVHLAIAAVKEHNKTALQPLKLKIAGKHYTGDKDTYWQDKILPYIDDVEVEYVGHLKTTSDKQAFLGSAAALLIPSIFEEPFGMVTIEALACGTPVIGLKSGAITEILTNPKVGIALESSEDIAVQLSKLDQFDRKACRHEFEARFTQQRMCREHKDMYTRLIK